MNQIGYSIIKAISLSCLLILGHSQLGFAQTEDCASELEMTKMRLDRLERYLEFAKIEKMNTDSLERKIMYLEAKNQHLDYQYQKQLADFRYLERTQKIQLEQEANYIKERNQKMAESAAYQSLFIEDEEKRALVASTAYWLYHLEDSVEIPIIFDRALYEAYQELQPRVYIPWKPSKTEQQKQGAVINWVHNTKKAYILTEKGYLLLIDRKSREVEKSILKDKGKNKFVSIRINEKGDRVIALDEENTFYSISTDNLKRTKVVSWDSEEKSRIIDYQMVDKYNFVVLSVISLTQYTWDIEDNVWREKTIKMPEYLDYIKIETQESALLNDVEAKDEVMTWVIQIHGNELLVYPVEPKKYTNQICQKLRYNFHEELWLQYFGSDADKKLRPYIQLSNGKEMDFQSPCLYDYPPLRD